MADGDGASEKARLQLRALLRRLEASEPLDPIPALREVLAALEASAGGGDASPTTVLPRDAGATDVPPGGGQVLALHDLAISPAQRYAPVAEIGHGGMGQVIAVRDRVFRRDVAMKILGVDEAHGGELVRFLQEAQITGQLEHPSIVPAYDLGQRTKDGRRELYYTMKWVTGRPMSEAIAEYHRKVAAGSQDTDLLLRRLLRVLQSVCLALEYAHQRGVLHRDLKPDNIVIGHYGEAYLVDWGIAKAAASADDAVETVMSGVPGVTQYGVVTGTPAYLAPEIARGGAASERSDVYGLGAILYQILAGRPPYEGTDANAILAAVVAGPPPPPSEKSGPAKVPDELQAICLSAMADRPEARTGTARALHQDLEDYLEGVKERERRHAEATRLVERGLECAGEYLARRDELRRIQAGAKEVAKSFKGHEPIEVKRPLWNLEARATVLRRDVGQALAEAERLFHKALEFEPSHAPALSGLADLYYDQFRLAEERQDEDDADYYRELVERYHDGKYARELSGVGTLRVLSRPAGAEVHLYRYEERDGRLCPAPWKAAEGWEPTLPPGAVATAAGWYLSPDPHDDRTYVGKTPILRLPAPMGSYLILVRKAGYRDLRYAVCVGRNEDVEANVRLFTEAQIGDGFVHVPAGRCLIGGDRDAPRALDRQVVEIGDFFISRVPVTNREYLEFINALAVSDPEDAVRHVPRWQDVGAIHWVRRDDGLWELPVGRDALGLEWDPEWPVVEVNWHNAIAYCVWRSRRDGRCLRLPSEREWEKAARGADGRSYPWGSHFDATWCNMRQSRSGGAGIGPCGEFPTDESPYGVRDLAGNVGAWCQDPLWEGQDWRVLRGGSWSAPPNECRSAYRAGGLPTRPLVFVGIRLVADPPVDRA